MNLMEELFNEVGMNYQLEYNKENEEYLKKLKEIKGERIWYHVACMKGSQHKFFNVSEKEIFIDQSKESPLHL